MNAERKKQIKAHIEGIADEDRRRAVLGVFEKTHGADHEETRYVRSLVDGSPVATNAELEADALASSSKPVSPQKGSKEAKEKKAT